MLTIRARVKVGVRVRFLMMAGPGVRARIRAKLVKGQLGLGLRLVLG